MEKMAKFFKLKEHNTNFKTEIIAGITTFMTMAYILAVNPGILEGAGMDRGAVFTATAISASIATLCMAIFANLPVALASGMGLNAYFAYTVAPEHGWQVALFAVLVEGIIFIIISFFNVREKLFDAIPKTIKYAVSVGIGLFICFIGLQNAGVLSASGATMVTIGDLHSPSVLLALAGVIITAVLCIKRVKGALLWGILATWILGIILQTIDFEILGMTLYPNVDGNFALVSLPPSLGEYNLISVIMKGELQLKNIFDFCVIVFAFLFVDIFDTIGTLIGVAEKGKLFNKEGKLEKIKPALMADAVGTVAGAILGTSTVTSYVESAAGVAEGGRTGFTALVTSVLFLLALVFSPIFNAIPGFATAPALIVVGFFMVESITKINFSDFMEGFPAFLCIVMMPLAYSISNGLIFGILSYVLLRVLTGKFKDVSIVMYVVSILFVLKVIFAP